MSPDRRPVDLSDPLQVAVKVTAIEGTLAMLQQQVSSGLTNVSSQLSAQQGELRDMGKSLREVADTQHEIQNQSEALERLARAIDRNSAEFAAWRDKHEVANQSVADKVTAARGALWVVSLVVLAVGALAGAYINAEFANVRRETEAKEVGLRREAQAAEARVGRELDALEKKVEANQTRIDEVQKMRGLR